MKGKSYGYNEKCCGDGGVTGNSIFVSVNKKSISLRTVGAALLLQMLLVASCSIFRRESGL